jgi:hypothetical protein
VQSLLPSPFLSLWCSQTTYLPLMQEITGAKPVRDAIFFGAWLTGKSRPTLFQCRMQSEECRVFLYPAILHSKLYTLHSSGGSSIAVEPALRRVS